MPEGKAKGRPRERGVRHPYAGHRAECRDGVVEPESVAPAQQVRCDSAKGMRAVQRDAPGGDCARRRRHGVRHDSELNTVTGSCSYEPNSTKALKSLVSYIAPLRMTRAGAVYGDAGMQRGMPGCAREGAKKKGPLEDFPRGGCEPSAAGIDRP